MTIRELRKGEFFTLKPIEEPKDYQVYVRSSYDPSTKKYEAYRWSNLCYTRQFKPDTVVYTDFTF